MVSIPLRNDEDVRIPDSTLVPAAAVAWLMILGFALLLLLL
jgi:hypothetical protein